jgi:hypothetical protein
MCVCVGIEGELLSGDSWLASMLSVVIGPSLVHTAVDTGEADWTGFAGVLRGVASIGGLLLVPSHREWVGVACDQMNMVV